MERRSLGQQRQEACCSLYEYQYQYGAVSGVDGTGVVCCCCSSPQSVLPAAVVTLVSEVVAAVLVLVVVVILVDDGIPLSHLHNVT